jgi:hypothetical protein
MELRKLIGGSAMNLNQGKQLFATPGIDINTGHTLVVSDYEKVLYDYRLREFPIIVNLNSIRATGYPHSFNEQTKIPSNTAAINPKLGIGTTTADYGINVTDTDYGRDNWKNLFVKCYSNRIQYDFFTRKWEEEYGSFEDLVAKDYNDMIVDFTKVTHNHFWNGNASAIDDTTSLQYCGILNQITDVSAIASGTKIADALNTKMAKLQLRLDYSGFPDVLCMNSATYDLLIKQEMTREHYIENITTDIVPGWEVPAIHTQAGKLPILITPFINAVPDNAATPTKYTHKIVALKQNLIDRVWMFNDGAQFFEFADPNMPLGNTRLLTDKAMMSFENYVLRAPQTGSHFILTFDETIA